MSGRWATTSARALLDEADDSPMAGVKGLNVMGRRDGEAATRRFHSLLIGTEMTRRGRTVPRAWGLAERCFVLSRSRALN